MMIDWWWALIACVVGIGLGALVHAWFMAVADDGAATMPQITEAEIDRRLADLARRIEDDRCVW